MGATVGGTIATNAAGAATFKYGTTRDWVNAITVVLPGGSRARHRARRRPRPHRRLLRDRVRAPHGPRAGPHLPHAADRQAVGRVLCSPGDGSHRSVHRLRGHARRRNRGDASRAAGQAGDVPGVRAVRAPRRRDGVRPPGARTGTRHVARARSERYRRLGDRTHGRALPRAAPRGRRRSSVWRHHSGGHGDGPARHARTTGRDIERPRVRGHRERPRTRRGRQPAPAILQAARRRRRPRRCRGGGAG